MLSSSGTAAREASCASHSCVMTFLFRTEQEAGGVGTGGKLQLRMGSECRWG